MQHRCGSAIASLDVERREGGGAAAPADAAQMRISNSQPEVERREGGGAAAAAALISLRGEVELQRHLRRQKRADI